MAQLAVMGLAVIDTIMAGRLSARDLAGVALGASIYISLYVGFMGVISALTPIAGHHFGAGRFADIGTDLGQTLWLVVFVSALGAPLLAFHMPWLRLTGAEPAVVDVAHVYLWAVAVSLPAALGVRAFNALNSAVSRPKITMAIQLAVLVAKVPLNLLFIHGAGPIPALGGAGCGVATAVLMWVGLLLNWAVWRLDPYFHRFRSRVRRGPIWARQKELLRLGLPSGGSLLIEVTSFTFIAILLARLGAVAVAGHQIAMNLVSVLYMVPLSLGIATSVLVAQSLGAGRPVTARRAALRGFRVTVGVAITAAVGMFVLREPIVAGYTNDPRVAATALGLLGVAAVFHVFDAVQGVAGFILRGYKVAVLPMLIHAPALWGLGLTGGYWLCFHDTPLGAPRGALGFWIGTAFGLSVAAVALTWLAASISKRQARRSSD